MVKVLPDPVTPSRTLCLRPARTWRGQPLDGRGLVAARLVGRLEAEGRHAPPSRVRGIACSSTVAMAPIPSPRPIMPQASVVVALTLTASGVSTAARAMLVDHPAAVGGDAGGFGQHDRVHVDDPVPLVVHHAAGFAQQLQARNALVARVRVRESGCRCRPGTRPRATRRTPRAAARPRRSARAAPSGGGCARRPGPGRGPRPAGGNRSRCRF